MLTDRRVSRRRSSISSRTNRDIMIKASVSCCERKRASQQLICCLCVCVCVCERVLNDFFSDCDSSRWNGVSR